MSQPHWKKPAASRLRVLLIVAAVVAGLLAVPRFFDEVQAEFSSLGDRQRAETWTGIKAAGRALRGMEWRIEDFLSLYGKKAAADPEIVVLGIDDASLDVKDNAFPEDIEKSEVLQLMGPWPWSREVHARVLEKLVAAGARTVVFDLLLPNQSANWPFGDEILKRALDEHKGKVLIGADWVTAASGGMESDTVSLPWEGFIPPGWPADGRVGAVTFWTDDDGVIRRARHFHSPTGELERGLPSFSAAVCRLQGLDTGMVADDENRAFRFSDPAAYAPLPVFEIFIDRLWERNFANGEFFKGKTILVGPAARQLQDYKATAIGTILGVQVHAHALAALKSGGFLAHAPLWLRIMLAALLPLLAAAMVAAWREPLKCMLALLAVIAAGFVVQLLLFNHASLIVPMAVPLMGWGLAGFIGLTHDYVVERREKEALRRNISRYFSPDMAEEILRNPDEFYKTLGGASRTITVLFSDVRGFTSMSETADPAALVGQLNEYLEKMVEIVFGHRGSIDKFIGDAVMAVWGRLRDPSDEKSLNEEAALAVQTAIRMRRALAALNENWKARGMQELAVGIGIHQGDAIVGNIGSAERMEFTAIGDTVNTASRLEGATKQYGADIIISDAVRGRVRGQFICRTADLVRVKGKAVPQEVFAVLSEAGQEPPRALELYEEGVRFYRQGRFADAAWLFKQARKDGLDDPLTAEYLARCEEFSANPPEKWDGVFVMTKK